MNDHEWDHLPDSDVVHPEVAKGLERVQLVDHPRFAFFTAPLRDAFYKLAEDYGLKVSFTKRSCVLTRASWRPWTVRYRLGDDAWSIERAPDMLNAWTARYRLGDDAWSRERARQGRPTPVEEKVRGRVEAEAALVELKAALEAALSIAALSR